MTTIRYFANVKMAFGSLLLVTSLGLPPRVMAGSESNLTSLWRQPSFAGKNAADKLREIHQRLQESRLKQDARLASYVNRLFWEQLAQKKTIEAKLEHYGQLRAELPKLPSSYPLERTLVLEYLTHSAAAQGQTAKEKLKILRILEDKKQVSWPALGAIYTGLLVGHLATDKRFVAADASGKLDYLRELEVGGYVKPLTGADFANGYAVSYLAGLEEAKRQDQMAAIKDKVGFFGWAAIKASFTD